MIDRNRKRKEYDEQVKMLDQNFAAAQNRRSESYNRTAAAEREDAEAALRRCTVTPLLTLRTPH